MLEGLALEALHGDEGDVFVFADFVDGADVGMVEGGGGAGFAAEALQSDGILGERFGEKFEGHGAAEFECLRRDRRRPCHRRRVVRRCGNGRWFDQEVSGARPLIRDIRLGGGRSQTEAGGQWPAAAGQRRNNGEVLALGNEDGKRRRGAGALADSLWLARQRRALPGPGCGDASFRGEDGEVGGLPGRRRGTGASRALARQRERW